MRILRAFSRPVDPSSRRSMLRGILGLLALPPAARAAAPGRTDDSGLSANELGPATIGLRWADGTRFRVTVYAAAEYDAMPEGDRPDGLLDDTGRAVICFTAAN
jgi:hypothetical protein